jgi:hypothetical protein
MKDGSGKDVKEGSDSSERVNPMLAMEKLGSNQIHLIYPLPIKKKHGK